MTLESVHTVPLAHDFPRTYKETSQGCFEQETASIKAYLGMEPELPK